METITPFANESESLQIAGLTIENRIDRVALYGSLDLTRDKAGLHDALALKALVDRVVKALEAERDLPEKTAAPEKPEEVKNPFQ